MTIKIIHKILRHLTTAVVAGIFLFQPLVLASVYGSGSYGSCPYSTGCSSSTTSPTPSTTPSKAKTTTTTKILLNDFSDYFTSGHQLDLKAGQVIYFDVTANNETVQYSVTINKVNSDGVEITINPGGIAITLNVGETKQVDVNNDGVFDIAITLDSISGGVATMTFKAVGETTTQPVIPAQTSSTPKHGINWLLIGSIVAICLGLGIFIWLFIRRRRDRNNTQMPPTQGYQQ